MGKNIETFNKEIAGLRQKIDDIDSKILSLLAERQAQVKKVVELKKKHGVPVYHPAREEDLISMLRMQAQKAGLDPDFMEELYRIILRQSRVRQTGHMVHQGIRPGACILIIGGAGQMGRFFSMLFTRSGYEVRILERNDWQNAHKLCKGIDLCLISVPIGKTIEIIDRIAPFLDSTTILADLTSIKEKPVERMLRAHSGPVAGLHPLFGPSTDSLDKQIIVVTKGRKEKQYQWLVDQLAMWGAVMVRSTAKEHDEIMGIVQALRHFATFTFGQFLYEKKIPLEKTLEFSSPIYRLELGMVGRLFAQDSSLYSEIIFADRKRRQLLKDYIASLNRHLEMLDRNNKEEFIEKFNDIAEWFGPFSGQALRESSFLINRLIERF